MQILFYCHYPDLLLSRPGSALKRIYRIPFDKLEEFFRENLKKQVAPKEAEAGVTVMA